MASETMEFDLLINGRPAQQTIRNVKNDVEGLGDSAGKSASIFENNWVMAGAKVAAAMYAVKQAFDFAKEIDTLNTKLQVATGSSDNAKNKFAELDAMATKMGLSTQSLVESYSSFRVAADLAGSSSENTEKIFKAVATASSAMKLSAGDTTGVFLALSQMLSKGTVSAEELRQQFGERIPGAMSMAAKAMEMTDAEFNKALSTGKIMANDLLPKLADQLENNFAKGALTSSESIQASYNRLGNVFTNFKEIVLKSLEGSGLIAFFAKAVTAVDGFIDRINRAITSIRDMSMIQREAERLDIVKQIAAKEEQIKNAYSFNKGKYEAELRALKSKLALIDDLDAKEQKQIDATKQEAKKTTPLASTKTDPWIAEKQKLELMLVSETSNAYQKQYETLESQRQADLKKFGTTQEKKLLINKAYDAQIRAVQEKALQDSDKLYEKSLDERYKQIVTANEREVSAETAKYEALQFIQNFQKENDYKNAQDAFKTREMAISLLDDQNSKTIALAQLEYEKNQANLDYLLQDNKISQENYDNQSKYLTLIRDKAIQSTSEIEQIMTGIASGVQGAFGTFFDFTSKGFLNFKNLAMSILMDIYKKMILMKIVNPMMSSMGFTGMGMGFAKGGVFDSSGIKRYAQGGIVNSPTQFRFAQGSGLMGEKGAEAIMPLKRMNNGNLGVETTSPIMKVEIKNESGTKMEVTSSTVSQDTEGMILGIVLNAVNTNKMGTRDMLRGLR